MKISEIISEMRQGRIFTGGPSTIDRSAPWVKQAMDQAGKLTMAINDIDDPAEKFKYVSSLDSPSSKIRVLANIGEKQRIMTIKSYDPATGEITMSVGTSSLTTYRTNTSDLEYIGRERSVSSNVKYYKFLTKKLDTAEVRPSVNKLVLKKQAEQDAANARVNAAYERNKAARDQYWDDNDDYDPYR